MCRPVPNICYIAYREYFKKRAEEIFAKNQVDADILVYSPNTVAELSRRDYLVLIARGGTAEELRQQVDLPVVDIPIMFQDIAAALLQARQYGPRMGVVGYGNFLNHLDDLSPILDGEIFQVVARTTEETRQSIQKLQSIGCDVIIGGYLQVEIAEELGLHHVLLDLYEDSLMEAYQQAETVVDSILRNARKQEELHTILSTTKEAYIAVDRAGLLTVANPAALRLAQISTGKVIGQPLTQVFPAMSALLEVLHSGQERLRETLKLGTTDILCDMIPLHMQDGKLVGAIATFNDVDSISKNEYLIRSRLHGKGLRAVYTFDQIIYAGRRMEDLIHTAKRYAAADASVLIVGETGVGKEMFAQSIHNASDRRKGPFVAINCASIPESILESELFGYEEGAFTGARRNGKPGYFELAHGGTIFLDEIAEMPVQLQARLLRVLQEKCVMRLGGDQVIPIDVRIIAATNQNLGEMIGEGKFRSDLFYRLNVLTLQIPPLRERPEDIPVLAEAYLRRRGSGLRLASDAAEALKRSDWRGNVRQLNNFLERLDVIVGQRLVRAADVEAQLKVDGALLAAKPLHSAEMRRPLVTKETLRDALTQSGGSRQAAADMLGIHRSTVWRLMKKFDLDTELD